jgi:hypothetical protein
MAGNAGDTGPSIGESPPVPGAEPPLPAAAAPFTDRRRLGLCDTCP